MILVMLDTGLRVQELCDLRVSDYDSTERRLHVAEGKAGKERTVAMGDTAALALWAYMASHYLPGQAAIEQVDGEWWIVDHENQSIVSANKLLETGK